MITPNSDLNIEEFDEIENTELTSRTYRFDFENKRIEGFIDGKEAILQAVIKILKTERYSNVIYDDSYGVELDNLIGKEFDYVISQLERTIRESLLEDDRISDVVDFNWKKLDNVSLQVSLTVITDEGELRIEEEVNV